MRDKVKKLQQICVSHWSLGENEHELLFKAGGTIFEGTCGRRVGIVNVKDVENMIIHIEIIAFLVNA